MLKGDLSTMPLSDLMQWVDLARKNVVVEIERPGGMRPWLRTVDREIVAASVPQTSGVLVADGTTRAPGPGLRALSIEGLVDLFFESNATFVVHEGEPKEAGVPLDVPIGYVVMEALRQLDDWPRIAARFPNESARLVRVTSVERAADLGPVQRAIVTLLDVPRALDETRLMLGLSHRALLRRVDELVSMRHVEVEGTEVVPVDDDLTHKLAEQAHALVRERQFAEAAHVLKTLLFSRPDDAHLARLLDETERQHIAACRAQLRVSDVVRITTIARPARLPLAEQGVYDVLVPKARSVAGLVIVSPLRELETLVAILALKKKGLVEFDSSA